MDETGKIQSLNPAEVVRENETLRQRVAELEATITALRAELERLQRRQHRQAAPFSRETPVAERKRPGRKPGRGTFTYRMAPAVDASSEPPIAVPLTESVCPHCGGELGEGEVEMASITDLPESHGPACASTR